MSETTPETLTAGRNPRWARLSRISRYLTIAAGSASARLSSFLATVIVARRLGPSEFGDFSLFFALLVPFSMATQFLDMTYVRQANTPGGVDRSVLLRASIVLKSVAIVFLALCAYPFGYLLAHSAFGRPELTLPLAAAVVAGSLIGMTTLWASKYLATRSYMRYSVLNNVFYLVVLAVLVPIFFAGSNLTPDVVYVIYVGAAIVLAIVGAAHLLRATRATPIDRTALYSMTTFASWLFAANLLEVIGKRLDLIVVAHYVPKADVGLYGAALRITVIASLLTAALSGFLLPRVAHAFQSRDELRRYLRETLSISVLIIVTIAFVWLLAPVLSTGLFGSAFSDATHLTRILLLGTLFSAISTPLGSLYLAEDVPRQILTVGFGRIVIILALTVALAPTLGVSGAAWAFAASEAFGLAYASIFVIRKWRRLEPERTTAEVA